MLHTTGAKPHCHCVELERERERDRWDQSEKIIKCWQLFTCPLKTIRNLGTFCEFKPLDIIEKGNVNKGKMKKKGRQRDRKREKAE